MPERRQRGIRYVTDDRLGEGTVGTFSVATNLVLKEIGAPPYWRRGITDWDAHSRSAREQIRATISARPRSSRRWASSRAAMCKRCCWRASSTRRPNVAILNKPTYGLDLHNQRLALDRIVAAAARGVALIVISTDLDELLEISDRIGVMFQGRSRASSTTTPAAGDKIRRLMTGAAAA